jgi:cell division protein ZipA
MLEEKLEPPATYIAISILSKDPRGFNGHALFNTLRSNHFHFDMDQQVFNRHQQDNPSLPVMYHVLSLREPGVFTPETISQQHFEGIVLLLVLQGSQNPSAIFEKMLTSARQLAVSLEGELCDDKHAPLNAHSISKLRLRIQESHRRTLTGTTGNGQQRASH